MSKFPSLISTYFCILTAGLFSAPVLSHYVYDENQVTHFTEASGAHIVLCARSEVSHGSHNGGYYKSNLLLHFDDCHGTSNSHRPRGVQEGQLAIKQLHYKWNDPMQRAIACTGTDWKFNSEFDNQLEIRVNHPEHTPRCGDGWYMSYTGGYLKRNGTWFGGWVSSGWHYLPAD